MDELKVHSYEGFEYICLCEVLCKRLALFCNDKKSFENASTGKILEIEQFSFIEFDI